MQKNSPRGSTPIPAFAPIVTGHFRETAGYTTWRPYGTADWLLIFTNEGQGRFVTSDGAHQIARAGDIALLRPQTLHDYGTASGATLWDILWTHFLPRPHWLDWLSAWPDAAPGMIFFSLPESIRSGIGQSLASMHHHARSGEIRRDAFAMNCLEMALLQCDCALLPFGNVGSGRIDERVLRARAYLQEHLSEPIMIATLAQRVDLSVSRLAHLFRDQTGQTPQQFQESERMARAELLLERTGRTITAIALEVGFENPFYFSLRFKKYTGLSPRDWRKNRHKGESQSPFRVRAASDDGSV